QRADAGQLRGEAGRDAVLHVARRDALHAFARAGLADLARLLGVEALHFAAVVELGLLQQREAGVRRVVQARQHGPQRGDLERVRREAGAGGALLAELPAVDLDLLGE